MSQDVEHNLIRRIVADRDLTEVVDAHVDRKFFLNRKHRDVFEAILEHYHSFGVVPAAETLAQDFPTYDLTPAPEPVAFYISQVRERHAWAVGTSALADAVDAEEDGDLESFKAHLVAAVRRMEDDVPNTHDVDMVKNREERWDYYMSLKERDRDLLGIPTGFPTIDKATQGLQPKQLVTFVGPPKAGKSTLMMLTLAAAVRTHHIPLFIGFEMSNEEQQTRFDAYHAGISHARLRSGTLTAEEEKRLVRSMKQIEDNYKSIIWSNDVSGATTLTGVAAKLQRYRPDVLFVDGVYMMRDEETGEVNTPQALTNLTRGFKRLAQNENVPVVISSQVLEWKMDRKRGITSNSIGYSSSFAQDSDVVLGVQRVEDEENLQQLKVVLSRNCPPLDTYVRWDWERGKFFEESEGYVPGQDDDDGTTY